MTALLLIPLTTALLLMLFPRKSVALLSMLLSLLLPLIQTPFTQVVGGWESPFGIELKLDLFSSFILFAVNAVFLATTLSREKEKPYALPLILFLQFGVTLTLVTADFFNLFVAFEILLTASYALFFVEVEEKQLKALYPYVLLNLIGSFVFLSAAALLYGRSGHLNMEAIQTALLNSSNDPALITFAFLMLAVIALKSALVPLHFWLPDSYALLPAPTAALFGGVIGKVSLYVLIRLLINLFPIDLLYIKEALLPFALVSMVVGVLGAASKEKIQEILSYHIVSQVGYIALALSILTPLSIGAALFFMIHNIFVKSSLFLVSGIAEKKYGSDSLRCMGGEIESSPFLASLFFIQALSLSGIPPLSGFFGKLFLFEECLSEGFIFSFFIGAFTSWLTLYSMIKIYSGLFLGEAKQKTAPTPISGGLIILTLLSVALGVGAPFTLPKASEAAKELFKERDE